MSRTASTWTEIRAEALRRINTREWAPGDTIPNEAELAEEFGCARATVNRALRDLADEGLLERRRKAGTRVPLHPVRRATLRIPVIRREMEDHGKAYGYRLIFNRAEVPPDDVAARMRARRSMLHVASLHLADGMPFMAEDRWIDPTVVPAARTAPFATGNANEWLLAHAPYTHGEIAFSAEPADAAVATLLDLAPGAALFVICRTTWDGARAVTTVTQRFAPGYRLQTTL